MNEVHCNDGESKSFLDWCGSMEADQLRVRASMSMGNSLKDALNEKSRRGKVMIRLDGKTMNFLEWCSHFQMDRFTVKVRINAGMTLYEAFELPSNVSIGPGNESYQKATENGEYEIKQRFLKWCDDYLADPLRVRMDMSMGMSLYDALHNKPKSNRGGPLLLKIDGRIGTIDFFCKFYNVASNTVRKRVGDGLTLEQAFTKEDFNQSKLARLIGYNKANEHYTLSMPLRSWCREYRAPHKHIQAKLNEGHLLAYILRPPYSETAKAVSICKFYNIQLPRLKKRLYSGITTNKALRELLRQKQQRKLPVDHGYLKEAIVVNGIRLEDLSKQCAKRDASHMSVNVLFNMTNGKRWATKQERDVLCEILQLEPTRVCPSIATLIRNWDIRSNQIVPI